MEKWLVVIVLCLPCIFGGAIPGQEKCAQGPSYWCSHIAHARECGATKHCLQTVWKMQTIQPKSTATCTYCELIVNEFRNVLQDKATEEQVATILVSVCAILPSPDTRDMCKDIVKEYTPEIIQMFENDISTDMICDLLQLCSGLGEGVSETSVKVGNITYCQDCMKFFQDVQASITSQETLSQLEQLINQTLCNRLGDFSSACMDLVEDYLPVFLQYLADQIDPDITCRVFGFCSTSVKGSVDVIPIKNIFQARKSMTPLQYRSSEECEICKDLFNQIVMVLRDKTVQDKVIYELKNGVCVDFGSFTDRCKELVDEYAPMLFELLVNELDPTTVCETLGLCQVPSLNVMVTVQEAAQLVGAGYVKDSTECTICKFLMTELDNILKKNETVKAVEDFIDKICKKLTTPELTNQCEAFVHEYGELVIDLLAQELEPNTFCKVLGLCKGSSQALIKLLKLGDSGTCQLCILVIQQIENAVTNISEADLLKDMKAVCSLIPGAYGDTCLKYVNEFGSIIVHMLKTKEDPKTLCQLGNMCQGTKKPYMTKPIPEDTPKVKVPSEECKICNTIVIMVKSFLQDNASREEVKQALESVCKLLPSVLQSTCEEFIESYGDNLIDLLMQELNATAICTELGLCQPAKKQTSVSLKQTVPVSAVSVVMSPYDTLPIIPQVVNMKVSAPSIECEVCDTVILYLKSFLADNASRAEIEEELKKLCTEVPAAFTETCQMLVDTYGDRIIDLILKNLDAHAICTELGLCQASNDKKLKMSEVMSPYDTLPIIPQAEIKKVSTPSIECEVCDTVILYLKSFLADNASREEIEEELKKLCTEVPAAFTETCQMLVDTYGNQIIDLILKNLDAHAICTELGLCQASNDKKLKMSEVMSPYNTLPIIPQVENKVQTKTGNAQECEVCKIFMNFLDKELQDNRTEENIKAALLKLCKAFPDALQSKCTDLVNTYAQLIIDYLLLSMSPDEICQKLSLCPTMVKKLPEPVHVHLLKDDSGLTASVKAGPACVLCEFVMKELDKILQGNKTEEAVTSALEKVCSFFPDTIRSECDDFVNTYSKLIINLLVNTLADPSTVCSIIRLCDAGAKINVEASPVCVICEFVMKVVDEILSGNKSEAAVVSAFEKVCEFFPDTIRPECESFVKTYSPLIVNLIVKTLADPSTVCTKIRLCQSTEKAVVDQSTKMKVEASPGCVICEFVMKVVDEILLGNKSEAAVVSAFEKVCEFFPDTIRSECESFVKTYSPLIVNLIVKTLADPSTVCTKIRLCQITEKVVIDQKVPKLDASPECVLCEFILKEVDSLLGDNKSAAAIQKALDEVCGLFPDSIRAECVVFVNRYSGLIVKLIVQEIDPKQICTVLGMCSGHSVASWGTYVKLLPKKSKAGIDVCPVCLLIVEQLQEFIKENRTTQEVEQFLKALCDKLPDTITVQCHDVVDEYVPAILDLLDENLKPNEICQQIGLCNTTRNVTPKKDDGALRFKPKLIGQNKCTYGPSYWCASKEKALECNAVEHCMKHVWN